jgi:HD-GYP domain-containing protein (c-di-GMP phosphodiesterase class II)
MIAITHSLISLYESNVAAGPWLLLAALTLLSGSATVRLPSVPATISISETFVFTSVILYGPSAGALIVALDGLIISCWFSKRRRELHRIFFNMAAPALSIWVAASVYQAFPGVAPLVSSSASAPTPDLPTLIGPLAVFTLTHFLINSWLIAVAVSFETTRRPFDIWRHDFLWLSLNYFGGASVSALLAVYTRNVDFAYVGIIIPLLLILYFTFKIPMARVEDANRHLSALNSLYLSTIETLAMAIDAKDQVTHGHIRRVQSYAVGLAKELNVRDRGLLNAIEASALLHDMGKLAIPEHILNKPGKLTPAEFEKMKLHASIGADLLSSIEFPYPVVPIVRHHHENWDGTGYPSGLMGTAIPLGARILAVVDCFDALTSDRPYRPRLTDEEATRILIERRGSMYDPLIVDTFLRIYPALAPDSVSQSPSQAAYLDHLNQLQGHPEAEAPLDHHQTTLSNALDAWLQAVSGIKTLRSVAIAVSVHDKIADDLVILHASQSLGVLSRHRFSLGRGLAGWVAATNKRVVNSDAILDLAEIAPGAAGRFGYCLAVPFRSRRTSHMKGVVSFYAETLFGDDAAFMAEYLAARLPAFINHFDRAQCETPSDCGSAAFDSSILEEHTKTIFAGAGGNGVEVRFLKTAGDRAAQRFICDTERVRDAADALYLLSSDRLIWLRVGGSQQELIARAAEIARPLRLSHKVGDIVPLDFRFGDRAVSTRVRTA